MPTDWLLIKRAKLRVFQGRRLRSAPMGSDRSAFDPLDLEIIDRVYEAAWAALIARDPSDNEEKGRRAAKKSASAVIRARAARRYPIRCSLRVGYVLLRRAESHTARKEYTLYIARRCELGRALARATAPFLITAGNLIQSSLRVATPSPEPSASLGVAHSMKIGFFDHWKEARFGEPIDQPLILAILIVLIAVTLYAFL